MPQPESGAESQWFRVDLQVREICKDEVKLARAGFIAFAGCSESALQGSVENLQQWNIGFLFDPDDPAHKVHPLCPEDALPVEQFASVWPDEHRTTSFRDLSYD